MPNRDDYFRCRFCKELFLDEYCIPDEITGALQCPNGCSASYEQDPYESPLFE